MVVEAGANGKSTLYYKSQISFRAAEISPRVSIASVSSVPRRASTQRSLRCSVCSVLRLERHGGHRESRFGCGQQAALLYYHKLFDCFQFGCVLCSAQWQKQIRGLAYPLSSSSCPISLRLMSWAELLPPLRGFVGLQRFLELINAQRKVNIMRLNCATDIGGRACERLWKEDSS